MSRIDPYLSNRCFIIGEKFNDKDFNKWVSKFLVLCDYEDIPETVDYYLKHPLERLDYIDKGWNYVINNKIKI